MITYPQTILDFLQNHDGLGIEKQDNIAVINPDDLSLIELIHADFNNIFLVTENEQLINEAAKYKNIKIVKGNELKTGLEDKSISNIFIEKSALKYGDDKMRKEFRRILENCWCDLAIIENSIEANETVDTGKLEIIFAGSWYEKNEFEYKQDNNKIITVIYWNPPGFSEEEMESKEILEFVKVCENYCRIIENYLKFTVREFLENVLRALTEYYFKAFSLPESSGSDNTSKTYEAYNKKDVNKFFELLNLLSNFLGEHDLYLSNFDPYPEDDDKETNENSLANDLAEIYEDIKSNLNTFENGNLYDKQEVLWQWNFDWRGHTGDHLTFAFRAIHWKLQYLV
jgi:hypothetical protein